MSIFREIGWFLLVLFLAVIFFTEIFYMLGKNQQNFGDLSKEELDSLPYSTLQKSLLYVTSMSFAETDSDPFLYGNRS